MRPTLTISVLSVLAYFGANGELEYDTLRWGSSLDTEPYWTFYRLSLPECYNECFIRSRCRAFSYHDVKKLCNLFVFDSTVKTIIRAPGYVSSEKRNWTERYPNAGCVSCDDVCTATALTFTCEILGCEEPVTLDLLRNIIGNVYTMGAKVKHVCKDDEDNYRFSECLSTGDWSTPSLTCTPPVVCANLPDVRGGTFTTPNGNSLGVTGTVVCDNADDIIDVESAHCLLTQQWSITEFTCFSLVNNVFDGVTKRIVVQSINKWWHNDGNGDKRVSARYQPLDSFVEFDFHYDDTDGTYRFYDVGWVCDGSEQSKRSLHTASCHDDAYTKFYIYFNQRTSYYRIISKANGRVVRIDGDDNNNLVSTTSNLADARSIYQFQ